MAKTATHKMSARQYRQTLARGGRGSKYRNKRLLTGDGRFDSEAEYDRWQVLQALQRGGFITELERQKSYRLAVGDVLICNYVADFVYRREGALVVEDVKGFITPIYRLKKKLMLAIHGIAITEYPPKSKPHKTKRELP